MKLERRNYMKPTIEEIKEVLYKIKECKDTQNSLRQPVDDLFYLLRIKPDIPLNPNYKAIPDDLYTMIVSLANNPESIILTEVDDKIILSLNSDFKRPGHDSHMAQIKLEVSKGGVNAEAFYTNSKSQKVLRTVEITTGVYVSGENVIRTMEGIYTIKENDLDYNKCNGNGFYMIHEYGSDGIEYGRRGITVANDTEKITPLTYERVKGQDSIVRTQGLNRKINANIQKDAATAIYRGSYVTNEFVYYRTPNAIDKLYVVEKDQTGVKARGVDFNLYDEHGIDNINRYGVGTGNVFSEAEYTAKREYFYTFENIASVQQKSPLSAVQLEIDRRKFIEEASTTKSTHR